MSEEYEKDFEKWSKKKKQINSSNHTPFFYEREIWWCSIGVNIGVEMDGKNELYERPVLILKKINPLSAWVLPISSTSKNNPYLYPLKERSSSVSISQWKTISSKRLIRKEGTITLEEYAYIIIRIKYLLNPLNETSLNLSIE